MRLLSLALGCLVSHGVYVIISLLQLGGEKLFVLLNFSYWIKYSILLSMSVVWYSVRLITNMHGIKTPTKHISLGFPAKWLIFIAFMLWPSFWNGSYFQPGQYFDTCLNIFVQRNLSSLQIAKDVRCKWVFLRNYNYECWIELQTSSLWGLNKYNQYKFNNI